MLSHLTIRPIACKGDGSIAHVANLNVLCGPLEQRV